MNAPTQRPPTSTLSMYRSIVGIGAFCALLIVTVFNTTAARIADNRARALEEAILEVLPAAHSTLTVGVDDSGALMATEEPEGLPVFLGYDESGALIGAAITAEGMGYADNIRILYAYSIEQQAITGMKVMETKETPGLGDRVEKEPHFIANFEALDASVRADGSGLANTIVTVKQGEKTNPWEVDGITGATITSVAIGDMISVSAEVWAPVLARNADEFATRPTTTEETN